MLWLKILAPVAGVLVVLFGAYSCGSDARKKADARHYEPIIAQKDELILDCQSRFAASDAQVTAQSAALDGLRSEAEARERSAAAEIRAARSEANVYRRKATALANAKPGPDQCESARELIVDTIAEGRP